MLEDKRVSVDFGRMSYYKIKGTDPTMLFIHHTSSAREWVPQGMSDLPNFGWIVPDLIGYGSSTRSEDLNAFTITQYASDLKTLLEYEGVKNLVIVGHGVGGLIGLVLAKLLQGSNIGVKLLFQLMGTLSSKDIMDDIGKQTYEKYLEEFNFDIERYTRLNTPMSRLIAQHLRKLGPLTIWAVHHKLEEFLSTDMLKDIENVGCPLYYLVGEELRGRSESEKMLKSTDHTVSIISNSQLNIHLENPKELWTYIENCILSS